MRNRRTLTTRPKNITMKYQVTWTERLSLIIEAESEAEAIQAVHDCTYDENDVSTEIYTTPEAFELSN